MNLHNGSLMQISSNNSNLSNTFRPENVAINYPKYNFVNGNLTLLRNVDVICPEFIVLDLCDHDNNNQLSNIYNYGKNIYISFEINDRRIIDFPIDLLWNLNTPEIINNKLYIKFPFYTFFGNIFIRSLNYSDANFRLINANHLANYVTNWSLICKTYIYGNDRNLDPSYNNMIQQISSLKLNVSEENITNNSAVFVLNTSMFKGWIKGFFIQSQTIDELNTLEFYINGHLRINFDKFFIKNKCVKINDNLLYFPFNNEVSYEERLYNSYSGSINFDNLNRSIMRLQFDVPRSNIKIYSLNMNNYQQSRGLGYNQTNINSLHLTNDFSLHPVITPEQIVSHQDSLTSVDMPRQNYTGYSGHYGGYTGYYGGYTGYYGGYTGHYVAYPTDQSINSTNSNLHLPLPSGQTIYQNIESARRTCGISLDEIEVNDRYMFCNSCNNNFKEREIKRWLEDRRTCPSCRTNWTNFNIYVNCQT